ncbi:MAG TPA: mannose-1-phosphate guanylyltransferase [Spirochaetia bacterium]|nr:mannose-1-phosphate guanylyltransferase [Spirochaetia bacterium]
MHREFAVIMAGGKGQRFWPKSRADRPKQFASITADDCMIKETVKRLLPVFPRQNIFLATGQNYLPAASALDLFPAANIIAEPCGRDTAACILLSVLSIPGGENDIFYILPADHYIDNFPAYHADIRTAMETASGGAVVIIGIKPSRPETGYGYIKTSGSLSPCPVECFREKPDTDTAVRYISSGDYLWNSGMFFFTRSILGAFRKYAPEHWQIMHQYMAEENNQKKYDLFCSLKKISFDYAVLEHCANLLCVHSSFVWDDVGSWNAAARLGARKNPNSFLHDCENTHVFQDDNNLFFVVNSLSNINIVKDGNIVYISDSRHEEKIKNILEKLAQQETTRGYI